MNIKKNLALLLTVLASSFVLPQLAYTHPGSISYPMTFFVTSKPIGDGGNLGGLAGADAHCQILATGVGYGHKDWRAYLSTQDRPGQPAINARDRIGKGPWYNVDGVMIARDLAHLHGDTIELARLGNNLTKQSGLTRRVKLFPVLMTIKKMAC